MNQPVFWSVLLGVSVLGAALRWRNGGPLLARWAVPVGRAELAVAGVAVLVLAFHCAAMFFAPWTDAIPGGRLLGDPVRALGAASQWSYWVPAAALLVALRRIWWPGLALLAGTLLGVGITMFWPYPLTTHLGWLAAVILAGVFVSSSLVVPSRPGPVRRARITSRRPA